MSKASSQISQGRSSGATRSTATLLQNQNKLAPHICVQREVSDTGVHPAAPSMVREVVKSPGRQLDSRTRSDMESRLGHDFSQVRVHTDERAAQSAQAVGANAYTAGSHVAFGAGRYTPGTPSGQKLLMHELTHVVQQASGPVPGKAVGGGLHVSNPGDAAEQEARSVARGVRNPAAESNNQPLLAASRHASSSLVVQRTEADDAAAVSAGAGVASAGLAGLFGILGTVYAAEAAHAGRRQADAAEDPPIPQPVEGGAKSNNPVDVPEVKAPDQGSADSETTSVKNTTTEARKAGKIGPRDTQTTKTTATKGGPTVVETITKHPGGEVETEKTTTKPAAAPGNERQEPIDLLQIQEGEKNIARYKLNLIVDDSDIKGGTTDDGEIVGYSGGSVASNVNVNFKTKAASPVYPAGDKTKPQIGAVQIQFGGFNTPPRIDLHQSSNDKPSKTANNPQRFSGTLRFDAMAKLVGKPVVSVNPAGTGTAPNSYGDGKSQPVVSIALNTSGKTNPGPKDEDKK